MSYDSVVIADSPVSYWTLADASGTTAVDSVGSNNGTYSGTFTLNRVPPGRSLSGGVLLDGSTAKVAVPTAAPLEITGSLSVEAWVKRTSGTALATIVNKPFTANSNPFFNYALEQGRAATNKFSFWIAVGTTPTELDSATSRELGVWYHVVGVYNGTDMRLYVNGVLDCTPVAKTGTVRNDAQPLTFGGWSVTSTLRYPGTISSVAVYNVALTPTQVLAHYQAAGPSPFAAVGPYATRPSRPAVQSGWGRGLLSALTFANEGSTTTGPLDAVTGKRRAYAGTVAWGRGQWGTCLAPNDATGQGAVNLSPVPIAGGATQFTLSVLCTTTITTGTNRFLWAAETATADMRLGMSNGVFFFQVGADGAFTNATADPPPLNVPVLVTCRLAPGGVRSIWYGPYKVGERTDASAAWGSGGAGGLGLGSSQTNTTRNWVGTISAGYVWNRALSDAEIVALAADPFAPVRPGKVSVASLAQGAGVIGNRRRRVLLCAGGG